MIGVVIVIAIITLIISIKIMDRMVEVNPARAYMIPILFLALAFTAMTISFNVGPGVIAEYSMYATFVFYQVSFIDFFVALFKSKQKKNEKPRRW